MFAKRLLQITLIVALLAACLTLPRGASAAGPCGSYYVVQRGDWLVKIAARCGVTLSALYAANPGLIYQRYIYPGQVLNIPGGTGPGYPAPAPVYPPPAPYQPPSICGFYPCPPYRPPYSGISSAPVMYYFPSMVVTPHVGGDFYWTRVYAGSPFTLQVKVLNNGNVSLQIVANLTTPSGWDFDNTYSDCPTSLAVGSYCTLSWVFTPQDTGYAYPRVYVRGFYTDSYGYSQRITQSPAFLVIVD